MTNLMNGRCGCNAIVARASLKMHKVECSACAEKRRTATVSKAGPRGPMGVDAWNPSTKPGPGAWWAATQPSKSVVRQLEDMYLRVAADIIKRENEAGSKLWPVANCTAFDPDGMTITAKVTEPQKPVDKNSPLAILARVSAGKMTVAEGLKALDMPNIDEPEPATHAVCVGDRYKFGSFDSVHVLEIDSKTWTGCPIVLKDADSNGFCVGQNDARWATAVLLSRRPAATPAQEAHRFEIGDRVTFVNHTGIGTVNGRWPDADEYVVKIDVERGERYGRYAPGELVKVELEAKPVTVTKWLPKVGSKWRDKDGVVSEVLRISEYGQPVTETEDRRKSSIFSQEWFLELVRTGQLEPVGDGSLKGGK